MGSPTCAECNGDWPGIDGCPECGKVGASVKTFSLTPTPPAPADDARRGVWVDGSTGEMHEDRPADDAGAEGRAAIEREMAETMRVYADDAGGAEAMRHDCAEIARRGAVAAYEDMTDAGHDTEKKHTYAECMEAVGRALSECEAQIRHLPLPARREDARDAVVEAAEAVLLAYERCHHLPPYLDALRAALDATSRASATPRVRGTRPEGHGGGK